MERRTPFPKIFWVANSIEILERLVYYGIYLSFGIYMEQLGYTRGDLGIIQGIFLFMSYVIPVFSGTFADRYGFKKVLIISYLCYLPSILLLIFTQSFSGIALAMLSIGLAAGIFKPLVSGTVRVVTDKTNKTRGFGIFYQMVNVGASIGPIIIGQLRASSFSESSFIGGFCGLVKDQKFMAALKSSSWHNAFYAGAIGVGIMLVITLIFYKEPKREISGETIGKKLKEIAVVLSDLKFAIFLLLLGVFFWLPFWAFFNIIPNYIDNNLNTAQIYQSLKPILPDFILNLFSKNGKILGETVSTTGFVIMVCQYTVSRTSEKFRVIPSFLTGLYVASAGMVILGYAAIFNPMWVFLGVFLFAVGEMISSPRIQEYITWLAPKEKAGLYMGANFLPLGLGSLLASFIYTPLYGHFEKQGNPETIWFIVAVHLLIGIAAIWTFTRVAGEFKEQEE